ncbi:MAG: PQQ-binding-like beta-propeller repeat protein [Pirellulales bacterium]
MVEWRTGRAYLPKSRSHRLSLRRIACDAARRAPARVLVVSWLIAVGQPRVHAQFPVVGEPPRVAPATVESLSSGTQRRLQQIDTLLKSEAWNEAIDVLSDLLVEPSTELVELSGDVFVPLQTYCQMRFAQLPPEALLLYRQRVDDVAKKWLDEGIASRDAESLQRVVDELFCSSSGDEALLALGELALERGDIGAAQGCWEAISPGLRGPAGQPLAMLLGDIDLAANSAAIREYISSAPQPASWLAYPDSDIALSDLVAKLVVASVRERNFNRAQRELALLELLDPQAKGRVAGSEVEYAAVLGEMIASAGSWPQPTPTSDWLTFAGDAARSKVAPALGPISGAVWQVPLAPRPTFAPRSSFIIINGRPMSPNTSPTSSAAPTCCPLVNEGAVLFRDGEQIRSVALETGEPAITPSGVLHEERHAANDAPEDMVRRIEIFGGQISGGRMLSRPQSLTVYGNTLLGIAPPEESLTDLGRTAARAPDRIIGLDLHRDGLLSLEVNPEDAAWRFSGPPVCAAGRTFVAMRRDEVQPQLFVACYSTATGRLLWRTAVCSSQVADGFGAAEQPSDMLSLSGDGVFFNTNVGIVAALEQHDGRVRWLRRYPRGGAGADNNRAVAVNRRNVPCLYHRSAIVVAPADAASLFALDPTTGATLWATDEAYDVEHLLGAVDGTLVASGRRLWLLDIATGAQRLRWPDSVAAGIRGAGRGCIAGNEVFWPTDDAIYIFDITTGGQSRLPLNLAPLGVSAANLVAANGYLLLAGNEQLVALGAASNSRVAEPQISRLPESQHFAHE